MNANDARAVVQELKRKYPHIYRDMVKGVGKKHFPHISLEGYMDVICGLITYDNEVSFRDYDINLAKLIIPVIIKSEAPILDIDIFLQSGLKNTTTLKEMYRIIHEYLVPMVKMFYAQGDVVFIFDKSNFQKHWQETEQKGLKNELEILEQVKSLFQEFHVEID